MDEFKIMVIQDNSNELEKNNAIRNNILLIKKLLFF